MVLFLSNDVPLVCAVVVLSLFKPREIDDDGKSEVAIFDISIVPCVFELMVWLVVILKSSLLVVESSFTWISIACQK